VPSRRTNLEIRHRYAAIGLVALALGLCPASAIAEEEGIKIGEGRLHPYLTLDGNYQSFAVLDPVTLKPVSDVLVGIRPGFRLSVPSPNIAFDLGGEADFIIYTQHSALNRFLASADMELGINRNGVVGLELMDLFTRSDNNSLVAIPYSVISNYNDASAKVEIRPGGGALIFEPGYHFIYDHFEPFNSSSYTMNSGGCSSGNATCNPSNASTMDYYINQGLLNARWRFLPKTSLLFNSNFAAVAYPNGGMGQNPNAPLDIVDASVGLAGLLTTRVEVILRAGYAQTILSSQAQNSFAGLKTAGDQHTVIGQAQVGYLFSDTAFIRVGFVRLLLSSPTVLAYYTDSRPYLTMRALVAGKLTLHLDFTYDIFVFPVNSSGSPEGRTDQQLFLDIGPEYEATRFLRFALGYAFTNRASNDAAAYFYDTTSAFGGPGYSNNQVYLKATLIY
jgi:hypothetical protein